MSILHKAHVFGQRAHKGQVRKYTGEPYFSHCIAVADYVATFTKDEEVITAAILHDTVEDCDVSIDDIAERFGNRVAEFVWYLTKPPVFVGDREKRKTHDRLRLNQAPKEVRLIKCMDLLHNSKSIKDHDPEFWKVFCNESILLLDAMRAGELMTECCGTKYKDGVFIPWVELLLEGAK